MKPTGSPWDNAILVPVELVWQLHSLPDGHEKGSELIGPPFDPARTPGIPAAVVRPTTIAAAYQLRNAYRTNDAMAFFPAEALTRLYSIMGDMRHLMSLLTMVTQALVLMANMIGVLLLFRFLVPQFVTLRALGAPRLFIAAVAWGFTATLILAGVLLGLGGGYVLSFAVSRWLAAETGVALSPTLGSSEYLIVFGILAIGWILALLPAYVVQRCPLATALTEN
jgi:putative ABC transport system permease protein